MAGLYIGGGILDKWNDMSKNAKLGRQGEESKFTGAKFHGGGVTNERRIESRGMALR